MKKEAEDEEGGSKGKAKLKREVNEGEQKKLQETKKQ